MLFAEAVEGFPAHAGMNLRLMGVATGGRWFPRPRGDEPQTMAVSPLRPAVSPPTRG